MDLLNSYDNSIADYGRRQMQYKIKEDETWLELAKRINWVSGTVLVMTPLLSLYGVLYVEKVWATMIWTLIYYMWSGFGITAGYHRLWSHKAYKAHWIVRLFLMLGGSAAVQGSCRWWCRNHRIHHRFTDTPKDPYNAKEGFLFSHFGWMFFKPDPSLIQKGDFDITDLESDPMVMIQNKYYGFFAIFMGFVFPTLVPGLLWGDWMGGYFFSAIARLVFVHHATFFVNSLAHWQGEQPYADRETPRDHFLTAFLTLGEGYHNFHHEFPQDFRNAIKFWQYDPTKWLISFLYLFGLTYDLQTFGDNEIKMGQWQIKKKHAMKEKAELEKEFSKEVQTMTTDQLKKQIKQNNKKLIIINNAVVDITDFVSEHPGGDFINKYIGKDATEDYNKLHFHTKAARLLMETKKVAVMNN